MIEPGAGPAPAHGDRLLLETPGAFHVLIQSEHGFQLFELSRFRIAEVGPLLLETL
jgi:hypothetical protein